MSLRLAFSAFSSANTIESIIYTWNAHFKSNISKLFTDISRLVAILCRCLGLYSLSFTQQTPKKVLNGKVVLYGGSRSFTVIKMGTSRKPVCGFLWVTNSNRSRRPVSHRFRDIGTSIWKLLFSQRCCPSCSLVVLFVSCELLYEIKNLIPCMRYSMVISHDPMFLCLDSIPACDRQTGKQTDRHAVYSEDHGRQ